MKIITLNLWGGKIYDKLIEFLKSKQDVDIFCFQEVFDSQEKEEARGHRANLLISQAL